jgi:thioredoxin 1
LHLFNLTYPLNEARLTSSLPEISAKPIRERTQTSAFFMRRVLLAFTALMIFAIPSYAVRPDIYPAPEVAKADFKAALKSAAVTHKRIILDFGGNWCGDCQVLDIYFHDPANLPLLEPNYVLVHINIGRQDENLDIADRYGIPIKDGVPALAVLDEHGKLLYSQRTGEFKSMRRMDIASVTSFLVEWKPKHGKS